MSLSKAFIISLKISTGSSHEDGQTALMTKSVDWNVKHQTNTITGVCQTMEAIKKAEADWM